MHRSSVEDWIRFYDDVIVKGGDWAPEAWFGAVEEAMARALPADSPILDTYRRRVEELLTLHKLEDPSEEEERRIGALEAEIQRLIGAADEVIRTRRSVPARTTRLRDVVEAPLQVRPRQSFLRAALTTAVVLILIGAGLLAALYLYDARLALRVDQEIDRYASELKTTVARLQAELDAQIGRNRTEQERLETLQGEVTAELEGFEREVDDTMATMTSLASDATRELERRLAERSGGVVAMLEDVAERAGTLDRSLGEVDSEIVALRQEIPKLGERLSRLAVETEESELSFGETMQRIAALKSLAPEIEQMADRERELLAAAIAAEHARLAGLQEQITGLGEELDETIAELAAARAVVAADIGLTRTQRAALDEAVDEIEAMMRMVDDMRQSAEAELTTTQAVLRERSESLLNDLAEKADLAMLRGDDVLGRVEQHIEARVETAAGQAMQAFGERREQELGVLAARVAETRSELDRTRQELIGSWRRMDEEVAARQKALFDDLDRYARRIEAKVSDIARTLDMVASAETSAPR